MFRSPCRKSDQRAHRVRRQAESVSRGADRPCLLAQGSRAPAGRNGGPPGFCGAPCRPGPPEKANVTAPCFCLKGARPHAARGVKRGQGGAFRASPPGQGRRRRQRRQRVPRAVPRGHAGRNVRRRGAYRGAGAGRGRVARPAGQGQAGRREAQLSPVRQDRAGGHARLPRTAGRPRARQH